METSSPSIAENLPFQPSKIPISTAASPTASQNHLRMPRQLPPLRTRQSDPLQGEAEKHSSSRREEGKATSSREEEVSDRSNRVRPFSAGLDSFKGSSASVPPLRTINSNLLSQGGASNKDSSKNSLGTEEGGKKDSASSSARRIPSTRSDSVSSSARRAVRKRNGYQWRLDPYQVISWFLFPFFALVFAGMIAPFLDHYGITVAFSLIIFSLISSCIILNIYLTASNSADPGVLRKYFSKADPRSVAPSSASSTPRLPDTERAAPPDSYFCYLCHCYVFDNFLPYFPRGE